MFTLTLTVRRGNETSVVTLPPFAHYDTAELFAIIPESRLKMQGYEILEKKITSGPARLVG
jgi:hypothetical protein